MGLQDGVVDDLSLLNVIGGLDKGSRAATGRLSVSHDLRAWSASVVMAITMPGRDPLEYGQS